MMARMAKIRQKKRLNRTTPEILEITAVKMEMVMKTEMVPVAKAAIPDLDLVPELALDPVLDLVPDLAPAQAAVQQLFPAQAARLCYKASCFQDYSLPCFKPKKGSEHLALNLFFLYFSSAPDFRFRCQFLQLGHHLLDYFIRLV